MLAELNWDEIGDEMAYGLRKLAHDYTEENSYNFLLIGTSGSGKTTFINNIASTEFRHLPTVIDGLTLSLLKVGKDLIYLWEADESSTVILDMQPNISELDGVFGLFDLSSPYSFEVLKARVGELILAYGKMYPLYLLANKADDKTRRIKQEDIMVYAYELGNCSCHRIPVGEMSALYNFGLDKVIDNMLAIVNCDKTNRCREFPALARRWCNIPQFYSFEKEPRQKLEIV